MKKILLPLVALMLSMVACQKENEGILTLEVEEYNTDAKLHLDSDDYAVWDNGDHIWLNGQEKTVNVSGTTATISNISSADNYSAFYPYEWRNLDDNMVYPSYVLQLTYPKVQNYVENRIVAPMAAYSTASDNKLSFVNLGAVLAVNVTAPTSEALTVKKIQVIADGGVQLSGYTRIVFDEGDRPYVDVVVGGSNMTVLKCNDGVTISAGNTKTFYIALPPVEAKLTIKVYDDYYCYERTQGTVKQYQANYGYNVPFDVTATGVICEQYMPKSNEIIYTNDSQIDWLNDEETQGYEITSHTFSNGKGVVTFDHSITGEINFTFFNETSITSVKIPEGVERIGSQVFYRCSDLEEITLPSTLQSIEDFAFEASSSNLQALYLYRTTPLEVSPIYYGFFPPDVTLHIPAGTMSDAWFLWWEGGYENIVDDL